MFLYLVLILLCQVGGVFGDLGPVHPAQLPGQCWGEVLKGPVLALEIRSYSDTEFLMHLVLYNKFFHRCPCGCEKGEREASLGSGDLFLRAG